MRTDRSKPIGMTLACTLLLTIGTAFAEERNWDTGYFNGRLASSTGWVVQVKDVITGVDTESSWTIPGDDQSRGWLADKFTKAVRKPSKGFWHWDYYRNIEGGWIAAGDGQNNWALSGVPYDILFNSMMEAMRAASAQNRKANVLYWSLHDTNGALMYRFGLEPQDTFHGSIDPSHAHDRSDVQRFAALFGRSLKPVRADR